MLNYFEYQAQQIGCAHCGWAGVGSQLEIFDQLMEMACPACQEKICSVLYPTEDETRAAAAVGTHEDVREVERL